MENSKKQNLNNLELSLGMEEIEIKYIKKFLKRNLKLLGTLVFSGLIISVIYAIRQRNVWQGEFQIVLESKTNSKVGPLMNLSQSIDISKIASQSIPTELDTEVEILKSPSVLMSVFDFVKNEKMKKNQQIKFRKWRNNLSIELEKGTSVLNIEYRDTEKSLILPVLKKISEKYQRYSGKEYSSELKKGIEYLDNQINIFSLKTKNSIDKAQRFSIQNNLPFLALTSSNNESSAGERNINRQINFEDVRVEESNRLKILDIQIQNLSSIENPLKILAFAKNILEYSERNLIASLEKLEAELSKMKGIYNLDSKRIKDLENKIKTNSQFLKQFTIENLKAQKYLSKSRKEAAERPIDIVLEYQNLWKEASRNNRIQNNLESQFIILKLDEAKEKDPWKLITNPTLLSKRVSPYRRNIVFRWLIYSSLLALLVTYLRERLENKIHKNSDLENLIPYTLIDTLTLKSRDSWNENITLFEKNNSIKKTVNKIGIISLKEGEENSTKRFFYEYIAKAFNDKSFYLIDDLSEITKTDEQILLFETSSFNKETLEKFLRKLKIEEASIIGWFLIEK